MNGNPADARFFLGDASPCSCCSWVCVIDMTRSSEESRLGVIVFEKNLVPNLDPELVFVVASVVAVVDDMGSGKEEVKEDDEDETRLRSRDAGDVGEPGDPGI